MLHFCNTCAQPKIIRIFWKLGVDISEQRWYYNSMNTTEGNMQNMLDIHTEATQEAKNASDKWLADWTSKTGGNEYGEPMYCGFAWVDVFVSRTNSKEAKSLESVGFRKSYRPKMMTLWNPADYHGQSMDVKEVGAQAYADVLEKHGFRAYMGSRAD